MAVPLEDSGPLAQRSRLRLDGRRFLASPIVGSRLNVARAIRVATPWLLAVMVLVIMAPSNTARQAYATDSVPMPFPGGTAVKIIQGYKGGTHQGRSQYGLDIVLANGKTGGAEVVSPFDGAVTWAQTPKVGNGCIGIAMSSGKHSVMMCHLYLNRAYKSGDTVKRGQTLGTVGPDGTVGNNGVAHIHYELHSGNRASNPVPFAEPDGLALEGVALPSSSTTAVVSKREPIVSSNRPGSGPAPATTTAQSDERREQMANTAGTAQLAASSIPSTLRSVQPPSAEAVTAARRAVVNGTDSCLKVRKEPSTKGAVVGCIKEGTELSLRPLGNGGDARWRQTDEGWVSIDYLKRTQAVVTGTNACLNVRESPKASAKKLGCLPDGTGVTIAEGPSTSDGFSWYRIASAGSVEKGGWVVGEHLD